MKQMDIQRLMQERYTTKAYDASRRLTDEQVGELMECLRLSPSSINSQPWGFKLVSDQATKERLAEHAYFNADKVRNASHVILLSVYRDAETFAAERLPDMDERTRTYFETAMLPQGNAVIESWLARQVYIALGVLLAVAASQGIDTTTMEGIDTQAYTQIQGDDRYKVLVAVALGYRDAEDINQPHLTPKKRRTDSIL